MILRKHRSTDSWYFRVKKKTEGKRERKKKISNSLYIPRGET